MKLVLGITGASGALYARATIEALRAAHGSFAAWIAAHHPLSKPDWVKLFRKTFRFAGPEIVGEFLMSIGYLPGAHRPDCPVYAKIAKLRPPWAAAPMKKAAPRK